jgi:hypothetical protein
MDWIVGVAGAQRPADADQAVEYVRAGAAPGQRQLAVQRAATGEYLNLFLTWERAMLFWWPNQVGLPHLLIARRSGEAGSGETEVAFEGRTPDRPWFVPKGDTLRRAEGLALLEEYVRTGTVPVEIPASAVPLSPALGRQFLFFEEAVEPRPTPDYLVIRWEQWGSVGVRRPPEEGGGENGLPF